MGVLEAQGRPVGPESSGEGGGGHKQWSDSPQMDIHPDKCAIIMVSDVFIVALTIFLLHGKFPAILGEWELGFLHLFYSINF